mgnify:CR=1 FL=1
MSFAYINPIEAFLEMTMTGVGPDGPAPLSQQTTVASEPFELDESWKTFEKELGKYKRDLAKVRRDYGQKMARLNEIQKSTQVVRMLIDTMPSDDLKARFASVLDSYESEEGADALTQQCRELKGEYEAKLNVLQNTEAERYDKFTCFVCQDRLVDLFIDPCGHLMCERCWVNTRDKTKCPGCRTATQAARKMYTM